jgi:hypothetical protein
MFALLLLVGGGAIAIVSPLFEHQADWFACRHMARMLVETPGSPPPMPPQAGEITLATVPAPVEELSLTDYRAGNYPHSHATEPLRPAILVPAPAPDYPVSAMDEGTGVFVSALETLIETSHKARNRRGLMHPSPASRIAFLQRLARDEAAEEEFSRTILMARAGIVALILAGAGLLAAALALPDLPPPGPQPAATVPAP